MKAYSLSPVCKEAKHWKENLPNELYTHQTKRRRTAYQKNKAQSVVSRVQRAFKKWSRTLMRLLPI
jgi:hypothetical protein